MSLRKKTYYIMGVATALLIALLTIIARLVALDSFTSLERSVTEQNLDRVARFLKTDWAGLESVVRDWAYWDDTYRFARDENPGYISSNYVDITFENLDVNFVILFDSRAKILFRKSYDLIKKRETSFPLELESLISSEIIRKNALEKQEMTSGFTLLSNRTALFAAGPILTSDTRGPARGVLIFGRWYDQARVEKISKILDSAVFFHSPGDKSLPREVNSSITGNARDLVIPRDSKTISGYTLIRDYKNHPAFILRADISREIYRHAKTTFYYYLLSLGLVILLFGGLIIVLLEYQILSRIMRLGRDIYSVGISGNNTTRVEVRGNDELAGLAEEINRMLSNLRYSEASLRESETRFMMLFENVPVMVFSFDRRGKCLLWNKECSHIMGWSPDELNATPDPLAFAIGDSAECRKIKRILLRADGVFREFTLRIKSGLLRKQVWADFLLPNKTLIFIGYDITDQRSLEEQLQVRQRMDSLGTLAGGVAHDFNNILTGIQGNLSLLALEEESLNPAHREYLTEAERACLRAADVVRQFQMFSNGGMPGKASVDLHEILDEVFGFLSQTTDRIIEKRNELTPGEFLVIANPSELHQVLLNLGTNSIQAIEKKGAAVGDYIRVTARVETGTDSRNTGLSRGEYIHVLFEDTGQGMSDQVRKRAFDPFFSTKEKGPRKAQGLGLAMVYTIITAHHKGSVEIESAEGKGTIFHIRLPRALPSKTKQSPPVQTDMRGTETILVVDDEESVRLITEKALREFGYTVMLAGDGEKGVEVFHRYRNSIDLVVLDLTMPRMTGKEVFTEIRKMHPHLPVILSTGHTEDEIDGYTLSMANGFLAKPYDLTSLLQTVRNAIEHGK